MISVHILEDHDKIDPMDWVRPLTFDGEANTKSCYSGKPDNNTKWVRVYEYFGDWVFGMKVGDYHDHIMKRAVYGVNVMMRFEFVRGIMPESHIWNLKEDD